MQYVPISQELDQGEENSGESESIAEGKVPRAVAEIPDKLETTNPPKVSKHLWSISFHSLVIAIAL